MPSVSTTSSVRRRADREGQEEETAAPTDPTLDVHIGSYASTFSETEAAVVRWEDGLALLPLPTNDPMTALIGCGR
jgi:hypothetical protein